MVHVNYSFFILNFQYALYLPYPSNIKMVWESTGCFSNNPPIGYRNTDIYLKSIKQIYSCRISSLQKRLHKMYTFGATRESPSRMSKDGQHGIMWQTQHFDTECLLTEEQYLPKLSRPPARYPIQRRMYTYTRSLISEFDKRLQPGRPTGQP